jgi:hypothetical protein
MHRYDGFLHHETLWRTSICNLAGIDTSLMMRYCSVLENRTLLKPRRPHHWQILIEQLAHKVGSGYYALTSGRIIRQVQYVGG